LEEGGYIEGTYVIREDDIVKKKSAVPMMRPEKPAARRLIGAARAVRNPITVKTRLIK